MGSFQPVLLTFSEERVLFLKEVNGRLYGVGSYFLGKTGPEMVPTVIFPILMTLVVYWLIGLNTNSGSNVGVFILVSIVMNFTGSGMGLMIGAAIPNAKVVQAVSPMIFIPLMLFSGFYANMGSIGQWISWFQYISPFNHGFKAYIVNQYSNQFLIFDPILQLSFNDDLYTPILYLTIIGIVCRLLALIFLKLSVVNL